MITPDAGGAGAAAGAGAGSATVSTVVLVMTDVEGSTRSWAEHPVAMEAAMGRHHAIVHGAVTAHGGWRPVDQGEGDAVFAAFESAAAAVAAVVDFQRALAAEVWPPGIDLRVRVGIHAGEVIARDGNLFGSTVNRCARLRGLGVGGQVLLSAVVFELVRDAVPDGVTVIDLGEHRMKDLSRAEHVHQLVMPGLPATFPPLASLDRARHNLPVQTSSFLGRTREIAELVELVTRERLVTIVGFGGMGKTRLALQVAAELATGDGDGVWFVDLSAVTDPDQVPSLIAATLGIGEGREGPLPAVLTAVRDRRLLLVLDNLEQLLPAAATLVSRLLAAGPAVRILVTTREPLRIRGEQEYPLAALPVPPVPRTDPAMTEAELVALSTYAAISLFIARASGLRPGFALTASNAPAIAAICAGLDGMPLAIELAAARTRMFSPESLLPRLDQALKVLTGGSRDLPTRHQTLRATIGWSYDALEADQQRLLDQLSVFPGSFTFDAAERICGPIVDRQDDGIDVPEALTILVERSLVQQHPAGGGKIDDRYSLLVSIRSFAAEQLDRAGHTDTLAARHLDYYVEVVSPMPDETRVARNRRDVIARAEVHNLRASISTAHHIGRSDREVALATETVRLLGDMGMIAECLAIGDAALSHVPGSPPEVVLLLSQLSVELSNGFPGRAAEFATRAVAGARELNECSLLAGALCGVIMAAPSRAAIGAILTELEPMVDALPSTGTFRPAWWVQDLVENTLGNLYYVDPDRALEANRLKAAQQRPYRIWHQVGLCENLLRLGFFAEAAALARLLEPPAQPSDAETFMLAYGALTAAQLRLVTGDLEQATTDLRHAGSLLVSVRLPNLDVWAKRLSAAVARRQGDLASAGDIVRRAVDDPPGELDPAELARATWLLAVITREQGAWTQAAELLDRAWAVAAGRDVYHVDLILECLLERAVHTAVPDPVEAVRLIGLVSAHRRDFALVDGVTYDTEAMLIDLRGSLGEKAVDRILTLAAAEDLPDSPTWPDPQRSRT